MNVAAYLIAGLTLVYTVGQVLDFDDLEARHLSSTSRSSRLRWRCRSCTASTSSLAALSVAFAEGIGLFALTYLLGRELGLHMQYFAAIGGYFAVLGLARLRLIVALIAGSFDLHILAWALFTQERAPLRVQPYELDQL